MPDQPVQIYTTAPAAFDWGWTKVLIENLGIDNRGRRLRLVEVEDKYHADMQFGRYRSGMYLTFYQDEMEKLSIGDYPLIVLTPDRHVYHQRTDLSYKNVIDTLSDIQMSALSEVIDKLNEDKEIQLQSHGSGYNITVKGTVEFCKSKIQQLTVMWNEALTKE